MNAEGKASLLPKSDQDRCITCTDECIIPTNARIMSNSSWNSLFSSFRSESGSRPAYIWPSMFCCDTDPDTVPYNSYISSQKSECYFRSLNKKTMNCNCTDPFAIEVCPLHALNTSIKTVTSSNEAKEENVLHFGTLPNCQCGQKYLKVSSSTS